MNDLSFYTSDKLQQELLDRKAPLIKKDAIQAVVTQLEDRAFQSALSSTAASAAFHEASILLGDLIK